MSSTSTLLVTGGAGCIGANVVRQRLAEYANEKLVEPEGIWLTV